MIAFITFCKTNPTRVMAILQAAFVCAAAFGAHLTAAQIASVTGLAAVILGLGSELVRASVTPMATLPDHVAAAVTVAANSAVPKVALAVPTVNNEVNSASDVAITRLRAIAKETP